MAYLGEIQTRGEIRDAKQVMEYLRQLEEQIRYALQNLDSENIQDGSIGTEQLSGGVKTTIRKAQNTADQSVEAAEKAQRTAERNAARINVLNSAQNALSEQVGALALQAEGLEDDISELEGDLAELAAKTVEKTDESGGFKVYLGSTQPTGHNILWIKPGADQGNGTKPCELILVE